MWPSPVGVFCLVWGTLGLLGSCAGLAAPLYMDVLKGVSPEMRGSFAAMEQHETLMYLYYAAALIMAGWLLWGGMLLFKRRARSVPVLWWWAVAEIPIGLAGIIFTYLMQIGQMNAMKGQAGNNPGAAVVQAMAGPMTVLTMIFTILYTWALPVFLLVWLRRASVRQGVARWFTQG
ncbi:MAG: hypothetical protein HBSAPP03_14030 [Phycisphaerae bacterium]|nr:MAG: hypothetical protein HBSAPP03_14030 [Phycisphaerae bacterium]